MADTTLLNVGEKLQVGLVPSDWNGLPLPKLFPGTAVINGPTYIGLRDLPGVPTASCMIGPPIPGASFPKSLEVKGITDIIGITNISGVVNRIALTIATGTTIKNAVSIKNGIDIKNALNIGNTVQNQIGILNSFSKINTPRIDAVYGKFVTCNAALGIFAQVAAPFKKFDIPHPNKVGYRLVHTCLEGPEIGVYYRGTLKNNTSIKLPEYWTNLIDPETISVHLTPHGVYQELYYKIGDWGKSITVLNNSGGPIDCSYTVYAERIDVEKLVVEYKEES